MSLLLYSDIKHSKHGNTTSNTTNVVSPTAVCDKLNMNVDYIKVLNYKGKANVRYASENALEKGI